MAVGSKPSVLHRSSSTALDVVVCHLNGLPRMTSGAYSPVGQTLSATSVLSTTASARNHPRARIGPSCTDSGVGRRRLSAVSGVAEGHRAYPSCPVTPTVLFDRFIAELDLLARGKRPEPCHLDGRKVNPNISRCLTRFDAAPALVRPEELHTSPYGRLGHQMILRSGCPPMVGRVTLVRPSAQRSKVRERSRPRSGNGLWVA